MCQILSFPVAGDGQDIILSKASHTRLVTADRFTEWNLVVKTIFGWSLDEKFCVELGENDTEMYEMIKNAYGETFMSFATVYSSCKKL